ncbi:hypothetical protein DKX38_012621 [Salix brachista]|uniref:Uncharacterized protein n=1 Tax=Salix brachista TaxID=2182728 RepID=A0A5N5LP58_9ROSI|nr:hypothetical protein DKX38_012621 [Salix brachista]
METGRTRMELPHIIQSYCLYTDFLFLFLSNCPFSFSWIQGTLLRETERGGVPQGNILITDSKNMGFPLLQTDEFSSVASLKAFRVSNQRGRVLGRSPAINLGFYSRASDDFVQERGGIKSW